MHSLGPATLVGDAFVVSIEQFAAEGAGETEHVIGTQEQVQLGAVFDSLEQFIGGGGGSGQQSLVVIQGYGLGTIPGTP